MNVTKMPKPSEGEDQNDFMGRCVPMMMDEGRDQDQAVAMCMSTWNEASAQVGVQKAPEPVIRRAVSVLQTEKLDDATRELSGIATTPTVDRMGDIVEPKGAVFRLPIPLLWQHKHDQPVGEVYAARSDEKGIVIKARILQAKESETLKKRFDEAWESIKLGLVRGLSIGFTSLGEPEVLQKEGGNGFPGFRFASWEWLELSLVTIPANVEATIQVVKAMDQEQRRTAGRVVRLGPDIVKRAKRMTRPGVVYLTK